MGGLSGSALRDSVLDAWRTNNRVTIFLIEQLPDDLWAAAIPGVSRRTIRMLAAHMHNARCMCVTGGLWHFAKRSAETRG